MNRKSGEWQDGGSKARGGIADCMPICLLMRRCIATRVSLAFLSVVVPTVSGSKTIYAFFL
jgi:hypothetical protein